MRVGRRLFKIGMAATLVLFLSLSVLFLVIWTWPGTILNTRNLERSARFLAKRGIFLEWKQADLRAESRSFFVKWMGLSARDFCFREEAIGARACFTSAALSATVDIKGWIPKYHLGPVELRGGGLAFHPPPGNGEAKNRAVGSGENFWPTPPDFLKRVSFERVVIELSRLDLSLGSWQVSGRAALDATVDGLGSDWKAQLDINAVSGKDRYATQGQLELKSLQSPWFGPFVVNAGLDGKLPEGHRVRLDLHGNPRGTNALDYALDAIYRAEGKIFKANIIGKGDPDGVDGILTGSASHLIAHFPSVVIRECDFEWKRQLKKKSSRTVRLNCPARLTGNFPRFKGGPYETVLNDVRMLLKADLAIEDRPGRPGSVGGKVVLSVDPLIGPIHQGSAAITTDVKGRLADFPKGLELESDLKASIPEFERVVELSRQYPWAIPGPVNALRGSIDLHVGASGELMEKGGELPITLTTRLSSEQQKLDLDGQGTLTLQPLSRGFGGNLIFKLALSDVQLVLPHLSMDAPPRLLPDKRIKRTLGEVAEEPRGKAPVLKYQIAIETPNGHPLRLVSNLAKDKVPIAISLQGTEKEPLNGAVRVLQFPVELFRRTATIQHVDIHLTPDSAKSQINGEIQVVYTDYTIRILILGLLSEPQIKFVSEPPLPEDKVLAVLLFGKTMDSLSSDQAASVGNTRAAVEDSAVSLASMYLLASTPVESVGYDPISHVFKAKVRLADGTSLNVGSDMTQLSQIGIRKQLGGSWTITTYLEHPFDPVERSLTAFLEWTRGY